MIDNVVLIVTGTLHERDVQELLEKCHPLGMFDRYCILIEFCVSFSFICPSVYVFFYGFLTFYKTLNSISFLSPQHCHPGSCTEYAGALQTGAC